jgi:hypothetical protein
MASDRAHIRFLVAEIGIPLLLVCALDLGFHWYVARTPALPVPQLFTSPITSGKLLAFWERERQPALDVLLLGMSQMMRVSGEQLQAALAERTQRPVSTFNFSGPFHCFALDQRLLRSVVLPRTKPAVVVYGLMPLALLNERSAAQVDSWVDGFPVFDLYTGSPAERLRGFLLMHVDLLQYREVIRDALTTPVGWKGEGFGQPTRANACGDTPLLSEHEPVRALSAWERDYQRELAQFDRVLLSTRLFDHLAEFARFCKEQGIELVLLSNPMHPLFLEILPGGRRDYDRYLALLRQAAARAQIRLFEPAADGIGPADLYTDTVHHDAAGGAWLTEELARYLAENRLVNRRTAE